MQKESNSIVTRSTYIATGVTFIDQANKIYKQLTEYQENLNKEIQDQVDRINELADIIFELPLPLHRILSGRIVPVLFLYGTGYQENDP